MRVTDLSVVPNGGLDLETNNANVVATGNVSLLGTGILVNPDLGGTGILDYTSKPGEAIVATYDLLTQMTAQGKAVGITLLWSGIVSLILYKVVDVIVGLRPVEEKEREGLDLAEHGERAYNY